LAIATNDVERLDKNDIVANLATLVNTIRQKNPVAKLAYSAILFRPRDIPSQMEALDALYHQRDYPTYTKVTDLDPTEPQPSSFADSNNPKKTLTPQQIYNAHHCSEKKRRQINKSIRKYCDANGIFFLQSWKTMQLNDKTVNLNYFARDGLHLNESGIDALKCYLEGNVATLIDEYKLTRGLKGAKKDNI
jgi:lysophospholipase L1-like esterase